MSISTNTPSAKTWDFVELEPGDPKLQEYDAVFFIAGMWNRMSEVAEAMIAVANNGYHKPAIECRDISKLAKR